MNNCKFLKSHKFVMIRYMEKFYHISGDFPCRTPTHLLPDTALIKIYLRKTSTNYHKVFFCSLMKIYSGFCGFPYTLREQKDPKPGKLWMC
jgi:hypothetical protein